MKHRPTLLALLLIAVVAIPLGPHDPQRADGQSFSGGANLVRSVINTTSQATTGTIEEVLATYTLPAYTFSATGKGARVSATFILAANGNSKTARLRFGGLSGQVMTGVVSTNSGGFITLLGSVYRTGANAQFITDAMGFITSAVAVSGTSTTTKTDTADIAIVATGETPTASGDLTVRSLVVEFLN